MSSKDIVLLAQNIEKLSRPIDPKGWFISEKKDGVRAVWDGQYLRTREKWHPIATPPGFTSKLPRNQFLDGELCYPERGYKRFQDLVSAVRKQEPDLQAWAGVEYAMFDAPDVKAFEHNNEGKLPFEQRLEILRRVARDVGSKHVFAMMQTVCTSQMHLDEIFDRIRNAGGEGIMLRQPGSLYKCGRSNSLLKVKVTADAEAIVTGHQPGEGRCKGMMGALHCKFKNGVEFDVGTGFDDSERRNPPRIGSKITIRYDALSKDGVPRGPRYVSVRDYE